MVFTKISLILNVIFVLKSQSKAPKNVLSFISPKNYGKMEFIKALGSEFTDSTTCHARSCPGFVQTSLLQQVWNCWYSSKLPRKSVFRLGIGGGLDANLDDTDSSMIEPTFLTEDEFELEKTVEGLETAMHIVIKDELYEQAIKYRNALSKLSMDDASTVLRLNQDFYDAFQSHDARKMTALWLKDPSTMLVHPHEDPVLGHNDICKYWNTLFSPSRAVSFAGGNKANALMWKDVQTHNLRIIVRGNAAWVSCTEDLSVPGQSTGAQSKVPGQEMYATNIFLRRGGGSWKLAARHVSSNSLDPSPTFSRAQAMPSTLSAPSSSSRDNTATFNVMLKDQNGKPINNKDAFVIKKAGSEEEMTIDEFFESIRKDPGDFPSGKPEDILMPDSVNIHITDEGIKIEAAKEAVTGGNELAEDNQEARLLSPWDASAAAESGLMNLFQKLGFDLFGFAKDEELLTDSEDESERLAVIEPNKLPDFNNGEGKTLMRKTIESLQRLKREDRISSEIKQKLIADVILHAPKKDPSLVEMAYDLLVLHSTNGWGDEDIVKEYSVQCEIIADGLKNT